MVDPLPGDIFRRGEVLNNTYEVEGVLGRGGTGEVYRARNQITGRVVAIKALNREFSANADYLELMKREEEIRSISHDAVVRYTDCNRSADGHVYLVMDYVDGAPLSEWLERGGARPRDLLVVAQRVAEGLVATHAAGIVHRDLSPDNVILRGGEPEQAIIIDFGIAKDTNTGARTIVGQDFAGKYEYAAPEQMHGRAEPRSDLYALGASLLATFRGRVPDVGRSPGEILRAKEAPLDTEGVPEPLRGLIDDLTQPDLARRPPSAAAVVAAIGAMLQAREAQPAGEARRSRRLWPVAVPAAAVVAGALWLGGVIDPWPDVPVAAPYTLTAEAGEGEARLAGFAPDEAGRQAILAAFGAASRAEAGPGSVALAAGAPGADWAGDVGGFLGIAGGLESWRLEVEDEAVTLSGVAEDSGARDAVVEQFAAAAESAGYAATVRVAAGPRSLGKEAVAAMLAEHETCGKLAAGPPEEEAYPLGAVVTVSGHVAEQTDLATLTAALQPRIGDRQLRLEAAVLNAPLCKVQAMLPEVPPGPVQIVLGYGDRDGPNLTGVYAVGDNPTIDILLPAEIDEGYLWVAIADVTGNVFNILPNINRREHRVAATGTVEGGVRDIRLAHALAEQAADPQRVAFTIDDTFGKSQVIVFHTDRPLFPELRPTTESAASFAEDLAEVMAQGEVAVHSVTTRLLASRD